MGSSKGSTTSTVTLSPEQRELINLGIPTFRDFINNPRTVDPRPVEGFNELQQQGQLSALSAIPGIQSRFEQAQQGLASGTNFFDQVSSRAANAPGTQPLSSFGDLANPYIQQAQQSTLAPITEALREQILPGIQQNAAGAGQLGGSRQGLAQDAALNQYTDRAVQALAPYSNQLYGQALAGDISGGLQTQRLQSGENLADLQAATYGLRSLPQIAGLQSALGTQSGLLPSGIIGGIGDQISGQNQAQQDALYNANLTNQFLPFSLAQAVLHGGSGIPGGSSTTESSSGGSFLSNILGAASTILPFFF